MIANRLMPRCTVIPVLAYPDVGRAIEWLCGAFGFTLRLRIGEHRAQLKGDGAVVLTQQRGDTARESHSVMVRVESVDQHYERANQRGARVLFLPADYPYGERQYSVAAFGGHHRTFSQS